MNYKVKFKIQWTYLTIPPNKNRLISMFKKRYFSAHEDFKTGFLCKFTLTLGIVLLIIFIFFKASSFIIGNDSSGFAGQIYDFSQTTYPDSILALSIIILFVGIVLYFFSCQFAKLAKIADEIEKGKDLEEPSEK